MEKEFITTTKDATTRTGATSNLALGEQSFTYEQLIAMRKKDLENRQHKREKKRGKGWHTDTLSKAK